MELSLFYRDLFGMVGVRNTATTSFGYRAQYTNDDQGHASGFELSPVRRSGDHDRIELVHTFLNAWGTQSREDGLAFGLPLGPRPEPTGEHPLDWDRRHGLALTAVVAAKPWLDVSWSTVGGSGLPWTPREQGRLDFDQTRTNSMRLPWSETTAVALQLTPRFLDRYTAGATGHVTLGLEVRNLFDERGDALTTTERVSESRHQHGVRRLLGLPDRDRTLGRRLTGTTRTATASPSGSQSTTPGSRCGPARSAC